MSSVSMNPIPVYCRGGVLYEELLRYCDKRFPLVSDNMARIADRSLSMTTRRQTLQFMAGAAALAAVPSMARSVTNDLYDRSLVIDGL